MIKPIKNFDGLNITFNITNKCNLSCRYCYEVNKGNEDLPLDYAKKFIDLILEDNDPVNILDNNEYKHFYDNGLIMDFIGGDGLANPELCDEILKYYIYKSIMMDHKWALKWRASISTNGTYFDKKEVKNFLEKYAKNISCGVSVDGCPEIHNLNRNDSMNKILESWPWYLEWCKFADIEPANKATLNKDSIPFLVESVRFLHEDLQLRHINMNFIFTEMGLEEKDYQELECQLNILVDYLLKHCDDIYLNMMSEERAVGKKMTDPDRGYCGAGIMPALYIDGNIYPCFRFMPMNVENKDVPDMAIGNIFDGLIRKDKFKILQNCIRKNISDERCLNCKIETACAWCIADPFACEGVFYREVNNCRINQLVDKYARIYWNKYFKLKNIDKYYSEIDYSNCIMRAS